MKLGMNIMSYMATIKNSFLLTLGKTNERLLEVVHWSDENDAISRDPLCVRHDVCN